MEWSLLPLLYDKQISSRVIIMGFSGCSLVLMVWEHFFTVLICETRLRNMTLIKYVLVGVRLSRSGHDLQQDVRRLDVSLWCRSSQGFSSHSDRPPC